jgi:hypothetical protein
MNVIFAIALTAISLSLTAFAVNTTPSQPVQTVVVNDVAHG